MLLTAWFRGCVEHSRRRVVVRGGGSMVDATMTSVSCVFCAIVAGEADAEVVIETDATIGFLDRTPLFAGHVLVVPRIHVVTLAELTEITPFFEAVQRVAAVLPEALGAEGTFVAMNNIVSQSVPHLHAHVVPRTKGDGLRGFFWPRTKYRAGEAAIVADKIRHALTTAEPH
jgi:histidine triad (HIT) family protein